MSVDLKLTRAFSRESVLVEPTCLVVLEHQMTSDRTRRILFDRVESVTLWRRLAWSRLILLLIDFGLAGLLLLLIDHTVARNIAAGVMLLFGLIMLYHLWCGVTRIRIVRDGEERTFSTIASPGRIRRFLDKLDAAIQAAQVSAWAELQEPTAAEAPPSSLSLDEPAPTSTDPVVD